MSYESELQQIIAGFRHDWLGYAMFAFPWGEPGTSLEGISGPMLWQAEDLIATSHALGQPSQKVQTATASGKGIGKSCLVAIKILAALSTFPDTRGVLTAGTEAQLRTKTWPELTKWYNMCINRHWFEWKATSIHAADPKHAALWRVDMIPWSENNKEAFAGLHNLGKRQFIIFDEASAIEDPIWETSEGIFTDKNTEAFMSVYGNPTRNTGRFRQCFETLRHRWLARQIDSRTIPISDKEQIDNWVRDWGEDSDYVRVNVRGMFPRVSSLQFISSDDVKAARKRDAVAYFSDPFVLGVDPAREGDDEAVLYPRKGRDARTIAPVRLRGKGVVDIATMVADMHHRYKFDAIHVDSGGSGGGVVDNLRRMNVPNVREVHFGGKPDRSQMELDATKYENKRAEMWGYMRAALREGLAIIDDDQFEIELTGVEFGFSKHDAILLEKKADVKKKIGRSPDTADALALTYAYPIFKTPTAGGPHHKPNTPHMARTEYEPYEDAA